MLTARFCLTSIQECCGERWRAPWSSWCTCNVQAELLSCSSLMGMLSMTREGRIMALQPSPSNPCWGGWSQKKQWTTDDLEQTFCCSVTSCFPCFTVHLMGTNNPQSYRLVFMWTTIWNRWDKRPFVFHQIKQMKNYQWINHSDITFQ